MPESNTIVLTNYKKNVHNDTKHQQQQQPLR